jgi:hypothetical protein
MVGTVAHQLFDRRDGVRIGALTQGSEERFPFGHEKKLTPKDRCEVEAKTATTDSRAAPALV